LPKAPWTIGLLAAGLIASGVLYTSGLDRVPAYLTLDEAHFSVHAASLASTGRNLNGQWLPPLVNLDDPQGEPFNLPWGSTHYLPFGIYLIAGALTVLPLDEATVRLPSALLGGVINVALIFAVALALFRSRPAAFAAAATLALAPANLIISRQALDSVCQPPFVLGALWCTVSYARKPDPRLALLCGVILGCGIYAYVTSIVFMPFYLALFWFISWRAGVFESRTLMWSLGGFAAAVLPMALWLIAHPEAAQMLQMQYNRADPGSTTLMQKIADGGVSAIGETLHLYWSYFDPAFLFVQGGNARNLSTGDAGVFLAAVAVLLPVGIYHARRDRLVAMVTFIGLAVSALPAVIKGTPFAIQRASGLLIYISLLAGLGFASLAGSRRPAQRCIAAALVLTMGWQFTGFYRRYHDGYRIASGLSYDPTAFRGVAELIIDTASAADVAAVYIPQNFYDAGAKWRFYTQKHHQQALWQRTRFFAESSELAGAPESALAVIPQAGEDTAVPPRWSVVAVVRNLGGEPTAAVVRKD
jgi:4-amino-4-deoxy-L-arabinose transferase-like glycosyltransferase